VEEARRGGAWSVDDWMMSEDDEGLDGALLGKPKASQAPPLQRRSPALRSLVLGEGGAMGR